METCIEFSKALNIVKFIATLSKNEKPQTDEQEAGMFSRQIRIRFHSLLVDLMQDFFLSSCCLNVQWFTGVYTLMCQWFPISLEEILIPLCSEHPFLCHCWTLMICSQPENVTFDSADWSWLLYNQQARMQMCVPLLHICFPLRPSHTRDFGTIVA